MRATDELRKLLDERGVEWMPIAWNPKRETFYHAANGVGFCADEYTDGVKIYTDATITPEQAIAATLGAGMCKLHDCDGSFSAVNRPVWRCDCGVFMTEYTDATTYHKPRYCPNCGRKVER